MNKEKSLSFVIVIIFIAIAFFLINQNISKHNLADIKEVKIAGQSIAVELSLTSEEHEQGLSGRIELKEDEGMLFVFDSTGKYPFWMKDMIIPIDIIWIGEDLKVIYIKKDARPESYPESYGPEADAKYILEVVSGFSEKNNLKEGDGVEFGY